MTEDRGNLGPTMTLETDTGLSTAEEKLAQFSRRPQRGVLAAIVVIAGLGWIYLAAMVFDMLPEMDMNTLGPGMGFFNLFNDFGKLDAVGRELLSAICRPETMEGHFGMPSAAAWSLGDLVLVFAMWVMMALAMMLPTAAPMIATYADLAAEHRAAGEKAVSPLVVAAGYLSIWIAFGAFATLAQWGLVALKAMSPALMTPANIVFASTTLVAAGIYQFTPAKFACLAHCQAPLPYFQARWTDTFAGVFRLGFEQGTFCVGCCWALMAVMFAVGVMNILWIAVLAIIMGIEKAVPSFALTRTIGIALMAWGAALFLTSDAGSAVIGRLF